MSTHELFEYVRTQVATADTGRVVVFAQDVFDAIVPEQAQYLAERFGAGVFMRLPDTEIAFFEWLKTADAPVWRDLWDERDETAEESKSENSTTLAAAPAAAPALAPYVVGMGLLPDLVRTNRGYPICDLMTEPNFYFSTKSFHAEEIKPYVDAADARREAGGTLTIEQVLVLEIRRDAIDVWRFAYHYNLPVERCKEAALRLVQDGLMKRGMSREELGETLED